MIWSLRLRLVLIILLPLLLIAALIGVWALQDAQDRANDRFERSLLAAALAISRDVAVSDGDALSPATNALLRDTSGGTVFYHVYAPDGVFVTGYATPPVPLSGNLRVDEAQQVYDGVYQGQQVRALRFVDVMQIEGLSGEFTITVWQTTQLRSSIVRDLLWRTFLVMATLVATVALVVWFGVRTGLRPLLDLESAIARRSSSELTPIRRKVPVEAQGIVTTLNRLFGQVDSSMQAKDAFISNAAHQLRNPIAGIAAMTDAVRSARNFEDMKARTDDLATATRQASDLANKLLTLERAKADTAPFDRVDIVEFLVRLLDRIASQDCGDTQIVLSHHPADLYVVADETMLLEAVINLIDNAVLHGGDALTRIDVSVTQVGDTVEFAVLDDGRGMAVDDIERAKDRFVQLEPSRGSGLGLAIAEATALRHEGRLDLVPMPVGLRVILRIPKP